MYRSAERTPFETTLRQLQVFTVALAVGCLSFWIIAVAVLGGLPAEWLGSAWLTRVSIAVTIVLMVARWVIPEIILAHWRKKILASGAGASTASPAERVAGRGGDTQAEQRLQAQLLALWRTRTIIAQALLGVATVFSIVAAMVDQTALPLVVAVVLLAGIIASFPTLRLTHEWFMHERSAL